VSRMSRPGTRVYCNRALDGPRPVEDDQGTRGRRMAARLAGPEPPRHPGLARPRRRPALARAPQEGPRLHPLYRGPAEGPRVSRLHAGGDAPRAQTQGGAQLPRQLHQRETLRGEHFRHDRECFDQEAGVAVHGQRRLPALSRQASETRIALGHLCRSRHRRDLTAHPQAAGRALPAVREGSGGARRGRERREGGGHAAYRQRSLLAPRDPRAPRPRIPLAGAQHADALARGAAAPAARHAGALQSVRGGLRARRAVSRAASRGHPRAARCARSSEVERQFALRGGARYRHHREGRLGGGRRTGGGRTRRPDPLQRSARGPRARRGIGDRQVPLPRRAPARSRAAAGHRPARPRGRHAQQPEGPRRLVSARHTHERHRRVRVGQIEPRQPGARRAGEPRPRPGAAGGRGRRDGGARTRHRRADGGAARLRPRGDPPARARGSEADRPDAALQPRDLHGTLRSRAKAISPVRPKRRKGITMPGASRSTSRRAAAHAARARAS